MINLVFKTAAKLHLAKMSLIYVSSLRSEVFGDAFKTAVGTRLAKMQKSDQISFFFAKSILSIKLQRERVWQKLAELGLERNYNKVNVLEARGNFLPNGPGRLWRLCLPHRRVHAGTRSSTSNFKGAGVM